MNIELLRSKMALKGDYDFVCLTAVTGLSKGAISKKCSGETKWKADEIRKIADFYELSDQDVISIFQLKGD